MIDSVLSLDVQIYHRSFCVEKEALDFGGVLKRWTNCLSLVDNILDFPPDWLFAVLFRYGLRAQSFKVALPFFVIR